MSLADFLGRLASVLQRAEIPYMLAGSFASSFHGQPRTTQDIDLVIHTDATGLKRLVHELPEDDYYVDIDVALQALRARRQFNVIDMATGWKADLIIRKARPYSLLEFERRQPVVIEGAKFWMASPEDVIVSKLEWALRSSSERQLRDVAGVLAAKPESLDLVYIEHWIQELNLGEVWKAVPRET